MSRLVPSLEAATSGLVLFSRQLARERAVCARVQGAVLRHFGGDRAGVAWALGAVQPHRVHAVIAVAECARVRVCAPCARVEAGQDVTEGGCSWTCARMHCSTTSRG
eukprot:scaffold199161_cov39-Tisochrysis_lutea.AAC.2